jgi:hypothetical protein
MLALLLRTDIRSPKESAQRMYRAALRGGNDNFASDSGFARKENRGAVSLLVSLDACQDSRQNVIIVRGDSHFATPEVMDLLEEKRCGYIFGLLSTNTRKAGRAGLLCPAIQLVLAFSGGRSSKYSGWVVSTSARKAGENWSATFSRFAPCSVFFKISSSAESNAFSTAGDRRGS